MDLKNKIVLAVVLIAGGMLSIAAGETAEVRVPELPAPPEIISLWEGRAIPFRTVEDEGVAERQASTGWCVGVTGIMKSTMIHYPASGKGPHPAVVVCPGGGYDGLAIKHEGVDVCAWLNSIGFSAFLLKYRVPNRRAGAHADAARALRLIRANATKWNVDRNRVGIIGFSAGGHLAASVSAPANPEPYPASDEADKLSFCPNFTLLIYPAYLVDMKNEELTTGKEFSFTAKLPPTFIVQSADDPHWKSAVGWFLAFKRANANVELHMFRQGGHGYGLLRQGSPANVWPEYAREWLTKLLRVQ